MRTSKSVCALEAGVHRMRGRSQFFGKRAPSAGSARQGPPLVVPVPASPKSMGAFIGTLLPVNTGSLGKSVHGLRGTHLSLPVSGPTQIGPPQPSLVGFGGRGVA